MRTCTLDGVDVSVINSRLRAGAERADPAVIRENAGKSFVGSYVLGMGFTLTPDERNALVKEDERNAARIFPYLGGEEINTSPTQIFDRYVINFGAMSLEQAQGWPDLLAIVQKEVKPDRERLANNPDGRRRKAFWWQFGRGTPALERAIAPLSRCLVTSRVTKHLCFSFQPTDRVLSEGVLVFALDLYAHFAVLQSRVHEGWARLLSSSMKADLRYAPSDCFETFPFPLRTALSALEQPGEAFYGARGRYMRDENVGLTTTYNRMRDSAVTDGPIEELRALTVAMDRAALIAYGWGDLAPPPFTSPNTDDEKRALSLFEDTVIDRLFALNAERAKAQGGTAARASDGDDQDASPAIDKPAKRGRTTKTKTSAAARTKKPA